MQYFQKLIGKDGGGLGYTSLGTIASHHPAHVWTLQRGVKKETGEEVLWFTYDLQSDPTGSKKRLAQTCLKHLKAFRHPDVLKFIGSMDGTDGSIQVVTEKAIPLAEVMRSSKLDTSAIQWGLVCIARAVGFLHQNGLVHGSLSPATIYVTPSGDWKLGGFEGTCLHADVGNLQNMGGLQLDVYKPPEIVRGNWSALRNSPVFSAESWALGCLIYAVHAGTLNSPEELRNIQILPKALHEFYQQLLASNPEQRVPCADLPQQEYFKKGRFVELNLFLDNLAIKDSFEKEAFLKKLPGMIDKLPRDFCVNKLLPVLCSSVDMGIGGSSAFGTIMALKNRMEDAEFKKCVVDPYAVKWFTNVTFPIQVRLEMMQSIQEVATLIDSKAMNEKVFPAFVVALGDQSSPALRDAAVKTCGHIGKYLSDRNLNNVLMAKFAALQVDPEPAIRTNTTVCIGKLASNLSTTARKKILVPAFTRSLRDPFAPARSAGLVGLSNTSTFYGADEIAQKIFPAVMPLLIDPETEVREHGFRLVNDLMPKVKAEHEILTKKAVEKKKLGENGQASAQQAVNSTNAWGFSGLSSITSALMGNEPKLAGSTAPTSSTQNPSLVSVAQTAPVDSHSFTFETTTTANGGASSATSAFLDKFNDNAADDDDDGWGEDLDDLLEKANASVPVAGTAPTAGLGLGNKATKNDFFGDVGQIVPESGKKDDLWNMLPTAQPKVSSIGTPASTSSFSSRKPKKSTNDDWESILGGSGGATKKKGPPKLGAVRR